MGNYDFTPGMIITGGLLLSLTVLSIYVSRVYLPARIKAAYLKSITVLAAAVETRDSGTLGHAQRVAQLAVEIARRLGLQGHYLERVQYAALIMDMGKARVPQTILNKEEPLTDEEWEVLKSHPKLSADMVSAVPFLSDLADIVLHHHELWDGSGYPDGLAGEQIPLESRILCVAADYDAMISNRPYHPRPLTPEEAVKQIKKGSGTKYDSSVVEIFLEVIGSGQSETQKAMAA
ncbi:MAG: HD-GYP domain-containing protein [Armatimonadota bacterium]